MSTTLRLTIFTIAVMLSVAAGAALGEVSGPIDVGGDPADVHSSDGH